MLLSQPSFHFDTLPFSSFLTHTLYPMSFLTTLISSFPLLSYSIHHITLSSSHFHSHLISSHHTSHHHSHCLLSHTIHLFILTTLTCLLSSSHLHHAHHLAYSSIIHPTSSSFHPPSIPSFSHFSLFHSSISPWCSSRFPQNSFSLISFIIPSYSLFHPPFHPISPSSPSSPLISAFHSHSHLCSLSIHLHLLPSHSSSHPLQSHSLLSISIPMLSFHSIASFSFISYSSFDSSFSRVRWYHRFSLSIPLFHLIHYSYHSSIFYPIHTIHIVSSLLVYVSQV